MSFGAQSLAHIPRIDGRLDSFTRYEKEAELYNYISAFGATKHGASSVLRTAVRDQEICMTLGAAKELKAYIDPDALDAVSEDVVKFPRVRRTARRILMNTWLNLTLYVWWPEIAWGAVAPFRIRPLLVSARKAQR